MNYHTSSNDLHNIHYEEVLTKKPKIIRFLQLQMAEIRNANFQVHNPSRKTIAAMPPGVDIILKKKNNMKFNGFYLIYDETIQFFYLIVIKSH